MASDGPYLHGGSSLLKKAASSLMTEIVKGKFDQEGRIRLLSPLLSAHSFPWIEARERFAREERFQFRIDSCFAPFLAGITFRP